MFHFKSAVCFFAVIWTSPLETEYETGLGFATRTRAANDICFVVM